MDLSYKLFKGASIQFHDIAKADEKASDLLKLPAVKQIWPVRLYGVPEHTVHWTDRPGEHDSSIKRRAPAAADDTFTPHLMTQVSLLRNKGILGKGIKVAVIDTGVSRPVMTHPSSPLTRKID
jgi:hypothetical protein